MNHELLIAILAGLGGMLGWGLADLFAKKTIDEIGDIVSLAWAHIFGTIGFFVIAVYSFFHNGSHLALPENTSSWLLLVFFGALQAIVYLLVYRGFGKGQVSVLNPIFASFSGLTALFSVIIFGELLTGNLVLALITLFLGILLLNVDLEALRSRKFNFIRTNGFKEIAIATVLAAIWTLDWDKFVGARSALIYAFLMYLFMTVAIIVYAKFKKINLKITKPLMWKFLVLIGLCETIAYLAITIGYSSTSHTSVVALLSGAFSLPTIILARTFLKEKVSALQTIGAVIIIIGIILLALL